jgi:hypothetical protein
MRIVLLALVIAAYPLVSAFAETPAQVCQRLRTDDTARPIPAALVPAVNRLFAMRLPTDVAVATTVYRCADSHVLVCTTGANLPCGKANVSRTSAGATDWCRGNPEAEFVPASATGHDTIFRWRCRNGAPAIVGQTSAVDPRGFVAAYWKRLQ